MTLFRFDFDYLKNRYEYELQRKEQLTSQLTLPVGVLGLLGSAIVAMARSFSYQFLALTIPFVVMLSGAALALIVCLIYLGRSYHRQTYVFLPMLRAIDDSRVEFLKFAAVMVGGEEEVLHEFENRCEGVSSMQQTAIPRRTTKGVRCCTAPGSRFSQCCYSRLLPDFRMLSIK